MRIGHYLLITLLIAFGFYCVHCLADTSLYSPPAVLDPTNIAGLPDPTINASKLVYVNDLGGGANYVMSNGVNWMQTGLGALTSVNASTTINQYPLISPANIKLAGSGITGPVAMNISTTYLYKGYKMHVLIQSGVLGIGGTFGINVGGGTALSQLGGTAADYEYDGTTLIKTGGGTL